MNSKRANGAEELDGCHGRDRVYWQGVGQDDTDDGLAEEADLQIVVTARMT